MGMKTAEAHAGQNVYWLASCKAEPISWHVGALEVIGDAGADSCGLAIDENGKRLFAHELPIEFFNHQLMRCETGDFDNVCSFVEMWGLPYSPYRYSSMGFRLANRGKERQEASTAFELTDSLAGKSQHAVVSFAEARHAIICLQNVVEQMRKAIMGETFKDFTAPLNAASFNGLIAGTKSGSQFTTWQKRPSGNHWEKERLTSAICNQIIDSLADGSPWRKCACDGCDVIFKRKQTNNQHANPRANSVYCCETCQNTQKSRNSRKAAKNRIDHGL